MDVMDRRGRVPGAAHCHSHAFQSSCSSRGHLFLLPALLPFERLARGTAGLTPQCAFLLTACIHSTLGFDRGNK